MDVELPEGATQKDLDAFLEYISHPKKVSKEEKSCFNCAHFKPPLNGESPYPFCWLQSLNCLKAEFNKESNLPEWKAKSNL
jgi:hypothetical protein